MPSCLSLMATLKRSSSSDSSLIRSVMALVNASCRRNSDVTFCQLTPPPSAPALNPTSHRKTNAAMTSASVSYSAMFTGPTVRVCARAHLWAVLRCGLHSDDDLVFQGMRDFVAGKQNLGILQQLTDTQTHKHVITVGSSVNR